ncbi:MAG: hypothetical protein ACI841_000572 [Planctomycetota bacterium]|jgi:hypothetical protein
MNAVRWVIVPAFVWFDFSIQLVGVNVAAPSRLTRHAHASIAPEKGRGFTTAVLGWP